MALQQKGCRTLQRELETRGVTMVGMIFKELGERLGELLTNQYGNYLFQRLIDISNDEQKREVVSRMNEGMKLCSLLVTSCEITITFCVDE